MNTTTSDAPNGFVATGAEPGTLTIGDRTRDGLLEITDTRWDSNGTMFVTVRELIGSGCWVGGLPIDRMRRLARRAIAHPEKTRSSRLVRQWSAQGSDHATFAVSRLDPNA